MTRPNASSNSRGTHHESGCHDEGLPGSRIGEKQDIVFQADEWFAERRHAQDDAIQTQDERGDDGIDGEGQGEGERGREHPPGGAVFCEKRWSISSESHGLGVSGNMS